MSKAEISKEMLDQITREFLHTETLEPKRWDHLDYRDVSVSDLRAALNFAYSEGLKDGGRKAKAKTLAKERAKALASA